MKGDGWREMDEGRWMKGDGWRGDGWRGDGWRGDGWKDMNKEDGRKRKEEGKIREREEEKRGDWITEDYREEERSMEISKTGHRNTR